MITRIFLILFFSFCSADLFGEETGLQVGNAGEGGGTFTFYDVVFGSGMIGILIWGLLFATSTAALVPWTPSVVRSEPDADFWKGISLKRGDVVAFYRIASDGTKTLAHSHTCITPSDKTMWGANNEGGWTNHWKWSLCTSEEYYNKTSPRVNYVEILPKP